MRETRSLRRSLRVRHRIIHEGSMKIRRYLRRGGVKRNVKIRVKCDD